MYAERSLTVITVARIRSFSFSLLFTFVLGNLRSVDLIDSSMGILTCTNLVFQNIEVLVMFARLVSSNGLHVNAFVTILTSFINAFLNAFVSS